jgi:signal transduction histidine kinase
LQQILVNLVNNALKFTQQGGVNMHFYCPDEAHWAIDIVDTGPGIPKEAQAYIFDPFRQIDSSATREHKGFGLGLAIVKQLVTLMGGTVTVISELGQGSTFTVILPLIASKQEK